jgi:hypothetical protein
MRRKLWREEKCFLLRYTLVVLLKSTNVSEEYVVSILRVEELCFHADVLLSIFLDPEDRGDMFFRNVG